MSPSNHQPHTNTHVGYQRSHINLTATNRFYAGHNLTTDDQSAQPAVGDILEAALGGVQTYDIATSEYVKKKELQHQPPVTASYTSSTSNTQQIRDKETCDVSGYSTMKNSTGIVDQDSVSNVSFACSLNNLKEYSASEAPTECVGNKRETGYGFQEMIDDWPGLEPPKNDFDDITNLENNLILQDNGNSIQPVNKVNIGKKASYFCKTDEMEEFRMALDDMINSDYNNDMEIPKETIFTKCDWSQLKDNKAEKPRSTFSTSLTCKEGITNDGVSDINDLMKNIEDIIDFEGNVYTNCMRASNSTTSSNEMPNEREKSLCYQETSSSTK